MDHVTNFTRDYEEVASHFIATEVVDLFRLARKWQLAGKYLGGVICCMQKH